MAMASTTSAAASMLLSGSMPSADGAGLMSSNFLARTVLPCSSSMATISASAPFPTVTLDLTHGPPGAPNAVPLSAARPPAPAQFQLPLPGGGAAPAFAVPPQDLQESKSIMDRVLKDPPAVIPHPAHPVHELKVLTTGGAQFLCDGCQEPGYGPRYRCETCNFDLHTWCALAPDTLMHPLFEGCRFVSMPASPAPDVRRLCDACGDRVRGFLYHCRERDLALHPSCAGLAMRFVLDSPAFELCKGVSPPCNMCIDNDKCSRFWFYRSHIDGEAVDIHVACVKRRARRSPDVGYLAHVAKKITGEVLRSLPMKTLGSSGFDRFCKDVATVASLIIAVIFGVPTSMVAALEWF